MIWFLYVLGSKLLNTIFDFKKITTRLLDSDWLLSRDRKDKDDTDKKDKDKIKFNSDVQNILNISS